MEFIRPKKTTLSIDMAPLVDCVFQLLIFFMLSSSFTNPALKLNLPKALEQDKREREQIIVSVDHSGNVFIDSQKTSLESLKTELAGKLSQNQKKIVHFRGDASIPYRTFVTVMDTARQAGATQINIVHTEGNL